MSHFERRYRLKRIVDLFTMLIVTGLLLLAWGGLTFYRQARPAEPPPDLAQAPTALPPTSLPPAATPTPYRGRLHRTGSGCLGGATASECPVDCPHIG